MGQLSDVRIQLQDARGEARSKDDETEQLTAFSTDLTGKAFVGGFYFDTLADGQPKGTPHCSYSIERKSGLHHTRQLGKSGLSWGCPHCKTEHLYAPSYDWETRP